MKRLFLIIALLISVVSFSQTIRTNTMPALQQWGSASTMNRVNGINYSVVGDLPALYADTTTANLNIYIKTFSGALIYTSSDGKYPACPRGVHHPEQINYWL